VGDYGVKIKKIKKIFRGSFRGAKFLTHMLSLFLRMFFFYVLAQQKFFYVAFLRPLVGVTNDFLEFLIF
jgi:hypothetical protein